MQISGPSQNPQAAGSPSIGIIGRSRGAASFGRPGGRGTTGFSCATRSGSAQEGMRVGVLERGWSGSSGGEGRDRMARANSAGLDRRAGPMNKTATQGMGRRLAQGCVHEEASP